jgi:hypothetical protein
MRLVKHLEQFRPALEKPAQPPGLSRKTSFLYFRPDGRQGNASSFLRVSILDAVAVNKPAKREKQ